MLRIDSQNLSESALTNLALLQQIITDLPTYETKVKEAKKWATYRRRTVFNEIKDTLINMCLGNERCMYCEDNDGDQIEHIKPKSLYPEEMFIWGNFLFACPKCNRIKNNKYAIIDNSNLLIEITRKKNDPVVPPPQGISAFLNPRVDNPIDDIGLDLQDTFRFVAINTGNALTFQKAEYTINTLKLNRGKLPRARQSEYVSYRSRLREYIEQKAKGEITERYPEALRRMDHPTVWFEMKRQHLQIPELQTLFEQAPEALEW